MPLQIETRREQGCLVIVIRGSFGAAEDAKSLRRAVDRALARGQILILVNMADVEALDNFGAESLLACAFMTTHRGGLLQIFGASTATSQQLSSSEPALLLDAASEEEGVNQMLDRAAREGIESKPFDILEFVREEEKRGEEGGPDSQPKLAPSS